MKKFLKWLVIAIVIIAIIGPVVSNNRTFNELIDNFTDEDDDGTNGSSDLVGDMTPISDAALEASGWVLKHTFVSDENGVLNGNNNDVPGVYSFQEHGEYAIVFKKNYYDPSKVNGAYLLQPDLNRFVFSSYNISFVDIKSIVAVDEKILPNTVYAVVYYRETVGTPEGDTAGDVTEEYLTFNIGDQEINYLEGMTTWEEVAEINEGFYIDSKYCEFVLYQGKCILFGDDAVSCSSEFVPRSYSLGVDSYNFFFVDDVIIYVEVLEIYDIIDCFDWFVSDSKGYVYFENKILLLNDVFVTVDTFSFEQKYVTSDEKIYTVLEFTVEDYEPFEYEEGMTWNDIVNNIEGFSLTEDGYVSYDGWILEREDGTKVSVGDSFNGGHFVQGEKINNSETEILYFSVGTMNFSFEAGMTWSEFVESDYNIDPATEGARAFSISDSGEVHYVQDDSVVTDEVGTVQYGDSEVVQEMIYVVGN